MNQVEDTRLITEFGIVSFETPIRQVVEHNDLLIVRLALMGRGDDINNIYAVRDGVIIWRVQDVREYNLSLQESMYFNVEPYTWIERYERDPSLLIGTDFGGFRYLIDFTTGKIVGEESWVK